MTETLFVFRDVVVASGGVRRLALGMADIAEGGITVVSGPSGAGKSTMLRCCNRLVVPSSGTVTYRGVDVADWEARALRRDVGMVFQRPIPFPGTVADNLRAAVALSDDEVSSLLRSVALEPSMADREATGLSGGEAQRMCLARTLTTRPSVLLADEPTSSLDPEATAHLETLALSLAQGGTTLVWVTHDPQQAERLADHHLRLGPP
nr:phosphate ABC transporter ATP-binding protein [Candidatus Microthrix sp.]